MQKCAEYRLPFEMAYGLLKVALERRPMGVRAPSPRATRLTSQERRQFAQPGVRDVGTRSGSQGWNNPNNQGVFMPGDTSVAQRTFDGYEPDNPFAPSQQPASQPAAKPAARPAPGPLPGPQGAKTVGSAEQAAAGGNPWAQYGQGGFDPNDPRMARMAGEGTGSQPPAAKRNSFKVRYNSETGQYTRADGSTAPFSAREREAIQKLHASRGRTGQIDWGDKPAQSPDAAVSAAGRGIDAAVDRASAAAAGAQATAPAPAHAPAPAAAGGGTAAGRFFARNFSGSTPAPASAPASTPAPAPAPAAAGGGTAAGRFFS